MVGFIGFGGVGAALARTSLKAGFTLKVYSRTNGYTATEAHAVSAVSTAP